MSTKKDLVEAHAFSRRRLVTAFVSGAPGGREVEPTRPGRILVGGVAITVLLLAGAAIAGYLLGRPDSGWLDEGSFIISEDTGEQYVVLRGGEDPVIQGVPNYLSAQLLLGEADLEPHTVEDKYISEVTPGPDLGIDGAPAGLPDAGDLIDSGWTACTADRAGVRMSLRREPQVRELADSAFLVTTGKDLWLVAPSPDVEGEDGPAHRYRVAGDRAGTGTLVDALGVASPSQAALVDEGWLNLFPAGPDLDVASFGLEDPGAPVRYTDGGTDLSGHRVGDLLLTDGTYYLLAEEGAQRLSDFAGLVYDAYGQAAEPVELDIRGVPAEPEYPDLWPSEVPTPVTGSDLCAVLQPRDDAAPRVALATEPGPEADPEGIARGEHVTDVAPSGGAHVLSGGVPGGRAGTPYVIDAKGFRYPLVGPDVATFIGYGDHEPPLVPDAWLEYFEEGVPLSVNAARRVPEDAPDDSAEAGS